MVYLLEQSVPILDIPQSVLDWLRSGERGLSSETIVEFLYGIPLTGRWRPTHHPLDVADLKRCLLLLQSSPETRTRLPQMAACTPEWARLVAHWEAFERLLLEEAGPAGLAAHGWRAPKTHQALRDILRGEPPQKAHTP